MTYIARITAGDGREGGTCTLLLFTDAAVHIPMSVTARLAGGAFSEIGKALGIQGGIGGALPFGIKMEEKIHEQSKERADRKIENAISNEPDLTPATVLELVPDAYLLPLHKIVRVDFLAAGRGIFAPRSHRMVLRTTNRKYTYLLGKDIGVAHEIQEQLISLLDAKVAHRIA